jgi:hypothetical protein
LYPILNFEQNQHDLAIVKVLKGFSYLYNFGMQFLNECSDKQVKQKGNFQNVLKPKCFTSNFKIDII